MPMRSSCQRGPTSVMCEAKCWTACHLLWLRPHHRRYCQRSVRVCSDTLDCIPFAVATSRHRRYRPLSMRHHIYAAVNGPRVCTATRSTTDAIAHYRCAHHTTAAAERRRTCTTTRSLVTICHCYVLTKAILPIANARIISTRPSNGGVCAQQHGACHLLWTRTIHGTEPLLSVNAQ